MVEKPGHAVDDSESQAKPGPPITIRFAHTVELAKYFVVLILGSLFNTTSMMLVKTEAKTKASENVRLAMLKVEQKISNANEFQVASGNER